MVGKKPTNFLSLGVFSRVTTNEENKWGREKNLNSYIAGGAPKLLPPRFVVVGPKMAAAAAAESAALAAAAAAGP